MLLYLMISSYTGRILILLLLVGGMLKFEKLMGKEDNDASSGETSGDSKAASGSCTGVGTADGCGITGDLTWAVLG